MIKYICVIFLLLSIIYLFYNHETLDLKSYPIKKIEKNENFEKIILNKNDIEMVFCPSRNCLNIYYENILKSTDNIKCAFYDLTQKNLSNILSEKSKNISVEIVVDDKNLKKLNLSDNVLVLSDKNSKTRYNNLMHNKFCIIDNKTLILGSANPTENGFFYNDNTILKFIDEDISKIFLEEFNQMKNGNFGYLKEEINLNKNFDFTYENESYKVKVFLCPKDDCENSLLDILNKTKKEILFLSFVMTNDLVENLLKQKAKENIEVLGVIENKNRNTISSIYKNFSNEFPLLLDKNKKTMHNKLFILDRKTLIIGSSNPTKSGLNYNDEFFLVIENENILNRHTENFFKIYNMSE